MHIFTNIQNPEMSIHVKKMDLKLLFYHVQVQLSKNQECLHSINP